MTQWTDDKLQNAHKHSLFNRDEIANSDWCACFYCRLIFEPSKIVEWIDDGQTAVCPSCSVDSVLGSAAGFSFEKEFFDSMEKKYF